MSLIEHNNIGSDFVNEKFDKTKQDPISSIPDELVLEIFSHLNLATLGTICLVNQEWQRLASEPTLWKIGIYREIAFGNDKWVKCCGEDIVKDEDSREEFSSLAWNDIIADCKKFKSIFPEKNAKDRLMLVRPPKTRNGQLTLKSLGELAKKYFPDSDTGYRYIWSAIIDELGDKPIDTSRWILMTKDVLPGSRNKSYAEQQVIVDNLAQKALTGYEIPETLEAAVCILSQYFDSNIRLFSDIYTRGKDTVQGFQTVVGGFAPAGLYVYCDDYVSDYFGVAALRKF